MMNCPRCGTPMQDGVCPECGFPVNRLTKKLTKERKNEIPLYGKIQWGSQIPA